MSTTLGSLLEPITPDAVRNALAARAQEEGGGAPGASLLGGFVCEQAAKAVENELLEVDVVEVLARAFATLAELREYADAVKYPREKPQTLVMTNKTISAPQDVEIGLEVDGLPLIPLVLTVDLEAELECVRLTVGGGCITAIDLGTAAASAGLRYRSVALIKSRRTDAVQLGSRLDLGEGIPIR